MCFDTAGRAGQVSQRHFASPSCAPQNMKHKRTSEATGLGVASLFLVFMTETQIVKVWLLPSPLCLALFFLPSLPCSFFPYFGCFSLLCFLRLSPLPLPSFWSRIFFLLSSSLPIFFSFPFFSSFRIRSQLICWACWGMQLAGARRIHIALSKMVLGSIYILGLFRMVVYLLNGASTTFGID